MKTSLPQSNKNKTNHPASSSLTIPINLKSLLYNKYSSPEYDYTYISTHNLIFNEKCLLVSQFKDFLIYDDITEFLRRYYTMEQIHPRLSRILAFFETYSKIFPNYMVLPESDYLFRNIRKKQKMIDAMNAIKQEEEENRLNLDKTKKTSIEAYQANCYLNVVFTPKINKSIMKYEPSKSATESNISSMSIWARKLPQTQEMGQFGLDDDSFAYSGNNNNNNNNLTSDENRDIVLDQSIEDIMHILNGKIIKSITDRHYHRENTNAIKSKVIQTATSIESSSTSTNAQVKLMKPLSTQQTPRELEGKKVLRFFCHHNTNQSLKNSKAIPIYNTTAIKQQQQRKNAKFRPESPSLNQNFINNIHNVLQSQAQTQSQSQEQSKPIDNLNIITNNFQSIVLPQPNLGGNTVININNNFFSCSDITMKRERHSRVKSASPPLHKRQRSLNNNNNNNIINNNDNNSNNPKAEALNQELTTKTISRSIKGEIQVPSLLSSFNLQESLKGQAMKSNQTTKTKLTTSHTRTCSANSNKHPIHNINYNSNDNSSTRFKSIGKYSSSNVVNASNNNRHLRSPLREKELFKEKILTNEIKQRFKMFIERSKQTQLSNRGLSSSISPNQKNIKNESLNNISNSMQKNSRQNSNQKKNVKEINYQMKMLDSIKNKIITTKAQSSNDITSNNNSVSSNTIIKVNTNPFFQKTSSNCLRKGVNLNKNSNSELEE